MIGFILLLIALACYFRKSSRWLSYVLYIGFLSNGYIVLIDSVIGVHNIDMAIIYTFVISLYLLFTKRLYLPNIAASTWIKVFAVFLIFSILFSLLHYGFTPFQILQDLRRWLLVFTLPIFMQMSRKDIIRVIKIIAYITFVTSVLYIAQTIVGHPILPYGSEGVKESATGLVYLYNSPPLLAFFLIYSFACPDMFRRVYVWRVVLFVALMCTLGRTAIAATIFGILVSIWLQGRASKLVKICTVLVILLIPFMSILTSRYEQIGGTGVGTSEDLQSIVNGKFGSSYSQGTGTMTYRFALVYERAAYLVHRPISEQVFGLGLITDAQDIVHRKYKFGIGLKNPETGRIQQVGSPDIAWLNTICGLGFGGTIIYTILFLSLLIHFLRNRNINKFYIVISAYMLSRLITSFSSSGLSESRTFAIFYLIMSTGFILKHGRLKLEDKGIELKI
ncbi:MAG: hypothetical protein LUI08_03860 [Prevotella sp.]|nr:hypothetical protein [Prevotella sp.]